ncbi:BppU family phage baseplate upper protein [Bacillus sp. SRB_8]|uniref:BppU family phage baseplate upper protein n=1 Tax=unclassified Bacillus (in: firmicutes) TaxID=185979 RepID=UPI000DC4A35A|nr:BppU family phage baseplate upper protein [Bacillus sp. SRB_8]RAN68708.1 hypothetical protein B5P40_19605 [Bacillus sp. SRB_8]
MPFKPHEINVDLIYKLASEPVQFSQKDQNSAKLLLNITNKTMEMDLSSATAVRISFKKPDGTRVFQENCQPINPLKGKYQVILKNQTLTAIGNVIGQVQIEEGDRIVETQKFVFGVAESISSDEAIESTNEYGVIQKIIEANENLEGVDVPALIESKETAEKALAKSAENTNQIGILSNNVSGVASQLADKTDKTYVDTKVSSLASGSPKGTYAT